MARRMAATLAPSRTPPDGISASACPRLSSISGTVTAPSMRAVSISQSGTGTCATRMPTASEASRIGLFQLPRVFTPGRHRHRVHDEGVHREERHRHRQARVAESQLRHGQPQVPALGRKAVGSRVRTGSFSTLSSSAASARSSASTVAAAVGQRAIVQPRGDEGDGKADGEHQQMAER